MYGSYKGFFIIHVIMTMSHENLSWSLLKKKAMQKSNDSIFGCKFSGNIALLLSEEHINPARIEEAVIVGKWMGRRGVEV